MKSIVEILKTKYPLIQAPMSWITDAKLVAAVSNAGGLGVLGPNAGQSSVSTDPIETLERMRAEINKTKSLTRNSFGINIILEGEEVDRKNPFLEGLLRVSLEENIKYYITVGEINESVFNLIKQHNGVIIHRPLTPTVEKMKLAESLGVDVLVATGFDEGGVIPSRSWGTFTVVPVMADAVKIPVLAAGGINDQRGVRASFALGAQGVYIGTRFIATKESPAAEGVKVKIAQSGYDDMVEISGTQRSIKTKKALAYASEYTNQLNNGNMDKEIRLNGGLRPGMLEGNFENGIISVNTGIDLIKSIPTVSELIEKIMN